MLSSTPPAPTACAPLLWTWQLLSSRTGPGSESLPHCSQRSRRHCRKLMPEPHRAWGGSSFNRRPKTCPPMICAQRLNRRARAIHDGEMMEIHLKCQMGRKKKQSLKCHNSVHSNNGGLKCSFDKWTIPVPLSVCKENHNAFKSLLPK